MLNINIFLINILFHFVIAVKTPGFVRKSVDVKCIEAVFISV